MEIHVFDHPKLIAEKAAAMLIEQVRTHPYSVLGLATGSSPILTYEALIKDHRENQTNYRHVKVFNLDEYFGLEHNHPASYERFMREQLFNHINIASKHCFIPNGEANDIDKECERYNRFLSHQPLDIQLLGIGANGHIGFNEPGTSFASTTHRIELDEQTRQDNARYFESIDDVPKKAITMGIANIMQAKKIILIATGKNKAEAVKAMVEGPITEALPASILQKHQDVVILLDQQAASLLKKEN